MKQTLKNNWGWGDSKQLHVSHEYLSLGKRGYDRQGQFSGTGDLLRPQAPHRVLYLLCLDHQLQCWERGAIGINIQISNKQEPLALVFEEKEESFKDYSREEVWYLYRIWC